MKLPTGILLSVLCGAVCLSPLQANLFNRLRGNSPAPTSQQAEASGRLSVQVREVQLRERPSFLAPLLPEPVLRYGESVAAGEVSGEWHQVVTDSGVSGWLHRSALSETPVAMKAGAGNVGATASAAEMALASKGFNADVEKQMQGTAGLNYSWVNRMESYVCTPEALRAFLEEGGLHVE